MVCIGCYFFRWFFRILCSPILSTWIVFFFLQILFGSNLVSFWGERNKKEATIATINDDLLYGFFCISILIIIIFIFVDVIKISWWWWWWSNFSLSLVFGKKRRNFYLDPIFTIIHSFFFCSKWKWWCMKHLFVMLTCFTVCVCVCILTIITILSWWWWWWWVRKVTKATFCPFYFVNTII